MFLPGRRLLQTPVENSAMRPDILPNAIETRIGEGEIIISKTDFKGIITYAKKASLRIAC